MQVCVFMNVDVSVLNYVYMNKCIYNFACANINSLACMVTVLQTYFRIL